MRSVFRFKQFNLEQAGDVFKLTTDATLLAALLDLDIEKGFFRNCLEIGTGTGVISLMLAQRFHEMWFDSIDINPSACVLASRNVSNSKFRPRIKVFQSDFLKWNSSDLYDLIVTNPPYFDQSTVSTKSQEIAIARHQIGLVYLDLITRSSNMLRKGGLFHMIFPFRYEDCVRSIIGDTGLEISKSIYIMHHEKAKPKNMIITAMKISSGSKEKSLAEKTIQFKLRKSSGEFSEEYKTVLKDFLLAF